VFAEVHFYDYVTKNLATTGIVLPLFLDSSIDQQVWFCQSLIYCCEKCSPYVCLLGRYCIALRSTPERSPSLCAERSEAGVGKAKPVLQVASKGEGSEGLDRADGWTDVEHLSESLPFSCV
jgi:hypothetical protein